MDIEQLRAAAIDEEQIALLVRLRERYKAHEVSELTMEVKYLEFVKYLVDSDRLHA